MRCLVFVAAAAAVCAGAVSREEIVHQQRIDSFLNWYDNTIHGTRHVSMQWYGTELGYGVVANEPLKDADTMFRVPLSSVVSSDSLLTETLAASNPRLHRVYSLLRDDTDKLAVFLVRERAVGALDNSTWWPYINVLPRSVPIPATWRATELALLQESGAVVAARRTRKSMLRRYNRVLTALREALWDVPLLDAAAAYAAHELGVSVSEAVRLGYGSPPPGVGPEYRPPAPPTVPEDDTTTDIMLGSLPNGNPGLPGFGVSHDSLQSFVWALTLLDSRALTLQGRRYLVPFADMLNYKAAAGAEARAKASGEAFLFYHRLEQGYFRVLVDRSVAVGQQVFEDYGDSDSSVYLQHHGFVPTAEPDAAAGITPAQALGISGNPMDCVFVPLPQLRLPARRELARALRMEEEDYTEVCIRPPRATGAAGQLPADPVPLAVHRWLHLAAMSQSELEACAPVLQTAAAAHTRAGSQAAADAARACFSEADMSDEVAESASSDGAAAAAAGAGSEDDDAKGSPAAQRRSRFLRLLRRVIATYNTTLADDEYLLTKLVDSPIDNPSAAAAGISEAEDASSSKRLALLESVTPPKARTPLATLALSYRATRKRMLQQLRQYYARTGPYAPAGSSKAAAEDAAAAAPATVSVAVTAGAAVVPTAAAQPPSFASASSADAPRSTQSLIAIGLTHMSPRDAAAYFTEAEYSSVAAQCDVFNDWVLSHNPAVAAIRAAPVGGGMRLGTVTTTPIGAEEVYLAVPTTIIMDSDSAAADDALGPVIADLRLRFPQRDDFTELLLHLIYEAKVKGAGGGALPASRFWPYLTTLPTTDQMLFPAFYNDAELAVLNGTLVLPGVVAYKADVRRQYELLKAAVFAKYGAATFPPQVFTLETHEWATAILDSRSIWWARKRHLVPLLDLINCNEGPNPDRVHATRLDPRGEYAITRADRTYAEGEQLFENYGQPNHIYFQYHGFALLGNSHDCVRLDLHPTATLRAILTAAPGKGGNKVEGEAAEGAVVEDGDDGGFAAALSALNSAGARVLPLQEPTEAGGGGAVGVEDGEARGRSLADLLLSRKGKGRKMSDHDKRASLQHATNPRTGVQEVCISTHHLSPAAVAVPVNEQTEGARNAGQQLEDAVRYLSINHDVDRAGALILLQGIAAHRLSLYAVQPSSALSQLLADGAAQVVLALAAEEDVSPFMETLLAYVRIDADTAQAAFVQWQQLLLHLAKDLAAARRALLPPRVRSALVFLVTEQTQLATLAGLDPIQLWQPTAAARLVHSSGDSDSAAQGRAVALPDAGAPFLAPCHETTTAGNGGQQKKRVPCATAIKRVAFAAQTPNKG